MNKILISVIALSGIFALSSSVTSAPQEAGAWGGSKDVAFGKKAWKALAHYRDWQLQSELIKGQSPHGKLVQMYSSWITIDKQLYPVIVKDNFGGRGMTKEKATADPDSWFKSTTIMVQREKGYDKEDKNWFYAKYEKGEIAKNEKGMLLAGRVGKGMPRGGCVNCHSQATGDDFLYSND